MGNNNLPEINNALPNEGTGKKKGGFSSKIGFVLAAAGSAIGLGNLWRFPYLAAKFGGGVFVFCYIILAVTIGFVLLTLEIGIGRKTGKSVIGAFPALNKKFKWFGYVCVIVPMIITPYYSVIGGWVIKYIVAFIGGADGVASGTVDASTSTNYFTAFTGSTFEPVIFFLIFAVISLIIVAFGVQKGIEKMSKILMPALAIVAVFLMIYVLCQPGAGAGVKDFLIPDFSEFSINTLLAALGQLFYSMSLAMCIMVTYGSYMKKEDNIRSSARQISIFDTAFAIIAGLIIIPAIFAFGDPSTALKKPGPSLMFIQLPVIFNSLPGGQIIGAIFFILVFFAALTSCISLIESIVAVLCEKGKIKRVTACIIVFGIIFVFGILSSLGFGVLSGFSFSFKGEPGKGILDLFDILANNVLMPIVAIITCVFAGWCIEKNTIPKELGIENNKLKTGYFNIMVKYIVPIFILAILISGLFLPEF